MSPILVERFLITGLPGKSIVEIILNFIFKLFIANVYKYFFYVLILYLIILFNSFISSNRCCSDSFRFSIYKILSSASRAFISSFPIWMPFIYLYCQLPWLIVQCWMEVGKMGILILFPILWEKVAVFCYLLWWQQVFHRCALSDWGSTILFSVCRSFLYWKVLDFC